MVDNMSGKYNDLYKNKDEKGLTTQKQSFIQADLTDDYSEPLKPDSQKTISTMHEKMINEDIIETPPERFIIILTVTDIFLALLISIVIIIRTFQLNNSHSELSALEIIGDSIREIIGNLILGGVLGLAGFRHEFLERFLPGVKRIIAAVLLVLLLFYSATFVYLVTQIARGSEIIPVPMPPATHTSSATPAPIEPTTAATLDTTATLAAQQTAINEQATQVHRTKTADKRLIILNTGEQRWIDTTPILERLSHEQSQQRCEERGGSLPTRHELTLLMQQSVPLLDWEWTIDPYEPIPSYVYIVRNGDTTGISVGRGELRVPDEIAGFRCVYE